MKYILSIDQGTTGTRAILFNEDLDIVASSYLEHKQIYPRPGWVEHDPEEIYNNCLVTAGNVLNNAKAAGIIYSEIVAMGISNQGETVIVWDKDTGMPVYNAIVWQCRRTSEMASELKKAEGFEESIRQKTGLRLDAYFSATKLKWIIDNVSGVKQKIEQGKLLAGTMDTWLIWKLTGKMEHVTDPSTASRTMLFNINTLEWDSELLEAFGIPCSILPKILPTSGLFGKTNAELFYGLNMPIMGSVVDQAGALFGHGCFEKGMTKCTYGTGCFMLMNIGNEPIVNEHGILTSVGWQIGNNACYVLDGGIYIAGAVLQWLKNQLSVISSYSEADSMAEGIGDTDDVFFVPAFSGLAAPIWDQYARGMIIGITAKTTKAHIVRAALESIAYQVKNVFDTMSKCGMQKSTQLQVDGGISKSAFLMQFQADILNIPVVRAKNREVSALGAAMFAGIAAGVWKDADDIRRRLSFDKCYKPCMEDKRRAYLLDRWTESVRRSMNWAEHV